jgi:hypothetical protein
MCTELGKGSSWNIVQHEVEDNGKLLTEMSCEIRKRMHPVLDPVCELQYQPY